MYRIILIDDEPLILAGIASLLSWEEHDCCIVGKATNGPRALELIEELQPDIMITDIRMPVMNGLELVEACQAKNSHPAVIFLTNLEDFQLARQAVRLGAVDYLIKLDLKPETLLAALERAKSECDLIKNRQKLAFYDQMLIDNRQELEQQYFSTLLFGSAAEKLPCAKTIAARYPSPGVILFRLKPEQVSFEQAAPYDYNFIRQQLLDVVSGIAGRYFSGFSMLLPEKDCLILLFSPKQTENLQQALKGFCSKTRTALETYFALTAICGISHLKTEASQLQAAYLEAEAAVEHYYYDASSPTIFYNGQPVRKAADREFNIDFLKKSIAAAVMRNEADELRKIFQDISELFAQYLPGKIQAISACIHLYTFSHDLFQNDATQAEKQLFPYSADIAEQLRQLYSLKDIIAWLNSFCEKLCGLLEERRENRSEKLISLTKSYISEHYSEKLTLSDIAEHLNLSAGYLSTTFSRFTGSTVSDYIAQVKIERAKQLLGTGQYLIYEVAEMLGFENAYYFSRVFKKVTGISPSSYTLKQGTKEKNG